jgi:hypothetical protein
MGQFNKYSVGVVAQRKGEKKNLLGAIYRRSSGTYYARFRSLLLAVSKPTLNRLKS